MNVYRNVDGVAKTLDVTPSTIKKYYLLFEKNNYKFNRNNQGQLMFSDYDMELFRKLIRLKNEPGVTVEKAVVQLQEAGIVDTIDLTRQITTVITEHADLKQLVQQQNKMMMKQQEQLNKMEERYELLMKSLRETKEVKRMIAASQEKKSFWSRISGG